MEVIRNFGDADIVSNLIQGRSMEESIKCLYRDHFESLAWYIMNNSGSRQDAEDIFQEVMVTFIDLVQKNKFRGESSIKTFLYSLNRYTWLNELKRRGRALVREEKFERSRIQEEPDTTDLIADREDKQEILKLVNSLGESCRKILQLFYYQDLSMKEIYEPVKEIVEHYRETDNSEKELLQVKEYYYKKKYLDRIRRQLTA